ncbi:TetR/AcrR family transcriptional regulator [Geobacter sp. SVR]|uniref:TetR/AcrR family transcriptional regulator n=1 Tax=Geobacter sp. SVR TaxID=2495594 RepID=UPI00143EFAC0|nr:TetR/AcrR family transcriptional regulator [Geobacter sp. SVR]BCS52804.1 TetR family transcriptional regulator [Geobacter sp. SVR]GCF86670.1 TetR family transcriptional regulator [Geobacter sp. SVR]
MGFRERRQQHKEQFKMEILEAALDLFSQEGYANFSMRRLAARIEYSPTTIYLYFRDKDDLLFHICENFYSILLQDMLEIRSKGGAPEQILKVVLRNYIHYGLSHPELYKVVFFSNPQLYGPPEHFLSRDTMSLRNWRNICEILDDCMASGVFRKMDSHTLAIVFWSAIHGLISGLIFTKDFPMPDPEMLTDMLLDGLFRGYRR